MKSNWKNKAKNALKTLLIDQRTLGLGLWCVSQPHPKKLWKNGVPMAQMSLGGARGEYTRHNRRPPCLTQETFPGPVPSAEWPVQPQGEAGPLPRGRRGRTGARTTTRVGSRTALGLPEPSVWEAELVGSWCEDNASSWPLSLVRLFPRQALSHREPVCPESS